MMTPREYKAACRKLQKRRALLVERHLEAQRKRIEVSASQRELKRRHKAQPRAKMGRLGATVHEEFSQAQLDKRVRLLGGICIYCNGPFQHLDHLVPVVTGGRHALWNLARSGGEPA